MNEKLLLVKSALLLYRESLVSNFNKEESSKEIIRKALEQIKKPEVNLNINGESTIIQSLKGQVIEMINTPSDNVYIKEDLLHKFKLLCDDDELLYESFADGFNMELDEFKLKQAIVNDRRSIVAFNKREDLSKIVTAMYSEFIYNRDKIPDVGRWTEKYRNQLEPFEKRIDVKDPAITEEFDIDNSDQVAKVAQAMSDEIQGGLGFQFGWQDVNAMFNGRLRRGECFVLNALQHNYKTGFSLSMFVHAALFNKPVMLDVTKKPLLVRISFEDSLTLNLQFIYKYLYENETGQVIDEEQVAEIKPEQISEYVIKKLKVNGFYIKMFKVDPLSWTLNDLFNKIIEFESQGFEVQLCMVDYLPKLPTVGCLGNNGSEEYRNMLERARQFFLKRKCTFMTPWQISTEAKDLIRNGSLDFVKLLPGRGYYAGTKQIDQVLDAELFIHKETYKGQAYLTVQAGKLRRIVKPTEDKLYRVYEFVPKGCIPWDLYKPNSARLKIGGPTIDQLTSGGDNFEHFGEL